MKNGSNDNGHESIAPGTLAVRFVRGDQYIEVTLQFAHEGEVITGLCPELGTPAFGEDASEVVDALVEAVVLQLETLEETGELERFLRDNHVELKTEKTVHWNAVNPRLVHA